MWIPALLFVISIAAGRWLADLQQDWAGDLFLIAALSSVASLILLLRAVTRPAPPRRRVGATGETLLIDGSNVMHWDRNTPSLDIVKRVVAEVERQGYTPLIGFDANVGYVLVDRYMAPREMAAVLGLPVDQVAIAPKGTPADPLLLAEATRLGTRIVTNDRYRDWAQSYPQVEEPGFLLRGTMREGQLHLDLSRPIPRDPGAVSVAAA